MKLKLLELDQIKYRLASKEQPGLWLVDVLRKRNFTACFLPILSWLQHQSTPSPTRPNISRSLDIFADHAPLLFVVCDATYRSIDRCFWRRFASLSDRTQSEARGPWSSHLLPVGRGREYCHDNRSGKRSKSFRSELISIFIRQYGFDAIREFPCE